MNLFIPPYGLDDLMAGYRQQLTMYLDRKNRRQIEKGLDGTNSLVIYISGKRGLGKVGRAASAAVFFKQTDGKKFEENNSDPLKDFMDIEDDALLLSSEDDGDDSDWESDDDDMVNEPSGFLDNNLKYLGASQIHLGTHTHNMAHYVAFVMTMLICSLYKIEHICIKSDSEILVKQVKGIMIVQNARLVYVMPIVHDLIKHFKTVQLDYVDAN